ncbi:MULTISPECIES: RNA polymerase sigma factor [Pseudanabaena]|uniref:RNA polymerase, sigma-24 subunit, ECF subfamily n=2 Tax=Pseudanabaena TaxID=1152 RepID=L8N3F1_9CYAN|nr:MULTISPECIES: sigma-70 family RNA polymerase sigma factor [Pseudanabaena]ELS34757.1 RNA polymerase, sigma-24 subunit, ECF subfamily [Pseudanabaena biceps PCC 7429]MDG3492994.1 sigma-70 family RNA polymerase sigma factor [Pseudanabaena catenata USMAC16]
MNEQMCDQNNCLDFWHLWQLHQNYLYNCCLKWMGGNFTDAEDVLSQAMLKACHEWPKYVTKVKHPKAWLSRLIHNFCIDILRKRRNESTRIENIEKIKSKENPSLYYAGVVPEANLLNLELWRYIQQKIRLLPKSLSASFILYYYQEKSYRDIAKQLLISEDNARRSVKKAKKFLQKYLNRYLAGEDDTAIDPLPLSIDLADYLADCIDRQALLPCDRELTIVINEYQEEINYNSTVICQEELPHHWYNSVSLLGWS